MRFKNINLYTQSVKSQYAFYKNKLGIDDIYLQPGQMKIMIGESEVIFTEHKDSTPYHFAINIPLNTIHQAHDWLTNRNIPLLKENEIEIHNFENWNAKAVYFYDTDHNIVEFIERKNTAQEHETPFSAKSFINVSELGIPVLDLPNAIKQLQDELYLNIYDGGENRFCALGNEEGLFICIDRGIKKWFPPMDVAYPSSFDVVLEWNMQRFKLEYFGEILTIRPLDK